MRIALIAHSDSPWTPRYARHFQAAGHEVAVFSFRSGEVPGVRTFSLRSPGAAGLPRHAYLTAVPRLRRLLRAFAPDALLVTYISSNGLAAALAVDTPRVLSAHGGDVLDQEGNPPIPAWLRRRLIRFACRGAHRVHSVSPEITEALIAAGVAAERIVTFPLGVDVARFPARPEPAATGPLTRLVCTRRHAPVYRNDLILDALARLGPEGGALRLTFVGGGPLLEARRRQAVALGLADRVDFVPPVEHDRMPDVLREAEIYVSASASDGTSCSLLEAFSVGLLPVVTRIRGNTAWVRDGENGFTFADGDAEDLAAALRRAIAPGPARHRAWGENPAVASAGADEKTNASRLLALLEEAARAGSQRAPV